AKVANMKAAIEVTETGINGPHVTSPGSTVGTVAYMSPSRHGPRNWMRAPSCWPEVESRDGLPGPFRQLERRRSRPTHSEASQSGLCEVAVEVPNISETTLAFERLVDCN